MSTRKTTWFYAALISVASIAIGMVIASRIDMAPSSTAQTMVRAADELGADRRRHRRGDVPDHRAQPEPDGRQHRDHGDAPRPGVRPTSTGDEFFRRFFGQPGPGQRNREPEESVGTGTGFIISKGAGLILTNNHVVGGRDAHRGESLRRRRRRRLRGQGRRPRSADRQRPHRAGREAVGRAAARKPGSATPT